MNRLAMTLAVTTACLISTAYPQDADLKNWPTGKSPIEI